MFISAKEGSVVLQVNQYRRCVKFEMLIVVPLLGSLMIIDSEASNNASDPISCEQAAKMLHKAQAETEEAYYIGKCYEERSKQIETDEQYDEHLDKLMSRYRGHYFIGNKYPDRKYWGRSNYEVSVDTLRAEEYLRIAANNGHIDAQYELGKLLLVKELMGRKAPKSWIMGWNIAIDKENIEWGWWGPRKPFFERYGLTEEEYTIYVEKANAARDDDEIDPEVVHWMRKAAEQGHIKAQFSMGFFAFYGVGRSIDAAESHAWYLVAVAQNPPFGSERRDWFAQYLTIEDKSRGEGQGSQFMKKYSGLFKRPSQTILQ